MHYIKLIGGPFDGFYFYGHGILGSVYSQTLNGTVYTYVCVGSFKAQYKPIL